MAIRCASGYSDLIDDAFEAGREAATRACDRLGELDANSVAILFCSIELDLERLYAGIREVLDIPLVGCTTYSEATDDGYFDDSASLMVLTGADLRVGVGLGEDLAADPRAAAAQAWKQARADLGTEPRLAIAFPDAGLCMKGEAVVDALSELGRGLPIFGGCPGDGGRFQQTYQILNDRIVSDSIPLLLLGGDIDAIVLTKSGWRPMGFEGEATRAEGNQLFEVDGSPAVDFLARYVGDLKITDPDVLGTFPIALMGETLEKDGRRHFVIRSPFFTDEKTGSVTYGGNIPTGATIQMGRSTRDLIFESVDAATREVGQRLAGRAAAAVLFASCGARKLMLGYSTKKEIEGMRDGMKKSVPIAGFYSYGEIGAYESCDPDLAQLRYHNSTLAICVLTSRAKEA